MLPGPNQVVACPSCKGLAQYMTLESGNTFGARLWTDGKQIAPMMPRPPAVAKCRHCADCYWLADAEAIGTYIPWDEEDKKFHPDWVAAPAIKEPTEDEYYEILEKCVDKHPDREKSLRIFAWWRRNDAFRDMGDGEPNPPASDSKKWRDNLEALAPLLTEDGDHDRLMKVEVLRELGQFEAAEQLLSQIDAPEVAEVVAQFRSLCEEQETGVRELHFKH